MENQTEPKLSAEELLTQEDYKRVVENLLFITDRPLSAAKISQVAEINNLQLTRDIIAQLQQEYIDTARAIQILEIGGGFQMATKPEYGRWVRKLFNEKISAKLSAAALETLAIIAYKQPVTRAEIEAIRGVDIVAPLEKIMERGLVKIVGKKDTPGKPMVYGTTDEFLRLFGLNKLSELPELTTFSTKGPREIQSDLPFSESLPELRENIIPLSEEEILLLNMRPIQNSTGIYTQGSVEDGELSETAVTDADADVAEAETSAEVTTIAEESAAEQPVTLTANEAPEQTEVAMENTPAEAEEAASEISEEAPAQTQEEVIPEGMGVENLKDLNS